MAKFQQLNLLRRNVVLTYKFRKRELNVLSGFFFSGSFFVYINGSDNVGTTFVCFCLMRKSSTCLLDFCFPRICDMRLDIIPIISVFHLFRVVLDFLIELLLDQLLTRRMRVSMEMR